MKYWLLKSGLEFWSIDQLKFVFLTGAEVRL